ncbi:hypothetical protein [Nostoc mirabile]|uniref:hypothetical protein n=1 Tax=Nostoc mirabile TaxID=2907820 RepID=UPI0027DEE7F3|nr:hypothetical protein [Nostoc mirabile]
MCTYFYCKYCLTQFYRDNPINDNSPQRSLQGIKGLCGLWWLGWAKSLVLILIIIHLSGFGANPKNDYLPGIYFMPEYLRTAIVAIHQLPPISETLWLRIIGRGNVQKQAIDELEALTPDNPFRKAALELLYNLQQNLQVTQNQDEEDRELLMRLAPLYQQDREQAKQQGIQQGERLVVENLLKVRFGEIDNELQAIIEPLLTLPPEEFTPLLLQLSREELIDRFS